MYKKIVTRQVFLFLADIVLVNLALFSALLLRFDAQIPSTYLSLFLQTLVAFTAIRILVFYFTGLYSSLWQYASIRELLHIVVAVSLSSLTVYTISGLMGAPFPSSVYLISWIIQLAFIGGTRMGMRLLHTLFHKKLDGYLKKVLIIGAGEAGVMVANELNKNRDKFCYKPVGYIDDDRQKKGKYLQGLKIFGGRGEIAKVIKDHAVDEIIIAIPSAPKKRVREVVELCKKHPVKLKILPGVYELIEETVTLKALRDVNIEDLLGRESVKLNMTEIAAYLEGQVVLITGGGGSIGSELCRQVLKYSPKKLLVFGQGENSIFTICRELTRDYPTAEVTPLVGSVQDSTRLSEVFSQHKPDVIFHAAAHKHVPLMEENPREAVKNNIFGTRNVAEAAHHYGAKHFVMVSTDKAVNPTSVMGATKRVAEMVIQSMSMGSNTRFCAVRFGNVLGSRGSVIPLFREQIADGGPVTVTHPDMVRYFMTIPEAVQLVIQAGAMGRHGEVFVLDMGQPMKILDLATDLIRLSGFEPGKDIDIVYTGIRSGEKLYEELLTKTEGVTSTRHEKIYTAKPNGFEEFKEELKIINKILRIDDKFLQSILPKVRHEKDSAVN
jgi:FlaA1/EpsC-like NDP-sugar epimerase